MSCDLHHDRRVAICTGALLVAAGGLASGATSGCVGEDDLPPGRCESVADCTDPGPCESRDLVSCEEGRCVYKPRAAGESCNDRDACTENDRCDDTGQCAGDPIICDDPPPPACVDDDAVYQAHYSVGTCGVEATGCAYPVFRVDCPSCSTACLPACRNVLCPDASGGCRAGYCDPASAGLCQYQDLADGTPCQLGTGVYGTCVAGQCAECTEDADCGDANLCTIDTCGADLRCQRLSNDGAPCDDGDPCTRGDTCSGSTCLGTWFPCTCAVDLDCDDWNPCTEEHCGADGYCVFAQLSGACDDGQPCTHSDSCSAGVCVGTPYDCDDQNACTSDICLGDGSCDHATLTSCDDGDPCTFGDTCNAQDVCAGTAYSCPDDGNPCTEESCDGLGGCSVTYLSGPCDDSNACTYGDTCQGGSCLGTEIVCSNEPCTIRACDGSATCLEVPDDGAPCDDSDHCTMDDVCSGHVCSGQFYDCDDTCALSADLCDGRGGCRHPNILLDAATSAQVGQGSGLSWSHTTGAAVNPLLLVALSLRGAATAPAASAVIYGSQALTRVGRHVQGRLAVELWALSAPPSGTFGVAVTLDQSAAAVGGASTWSNVDPSAPLGGVVVGGAQSLPAALRVASSAEQVVVDVIAARPSSSALPLLDASLPQMLLWFETGDLAGGGSFAPGSPAVDLSWQLEGYEWAAAAVALGPAVTTGTDCSPVTRLRLPPDDRACRDVTVGVACVGARDPDCDGLESSPFGSDPWPGQPNPLLLDETFVVDPSSRAWWSLPEPVSWESASSRLRMPAGGAIALGAPCTEALTTVDYLVELRFTVVSFANPADWQLELESAEADAFGGRHCQLLRLAGSYADAPTTHVSWRGSGRGDVSQPAIAVSPGHTYVLQSWGEADPDSSTRRHHCRLLDTDGATELRHAVLDSDLSGAVGPGTISVRTSDVEILVDHIRAYRDPQ